jgi:CDGSH-type Zn-finger protein
MYPIIEIIEEAKQVKWCGCKSSENKPFCDGSHKKYL